jgi:muramidase (phage lysozyme)
MSARIDPSEVGLNCVAFLDMIAVSEGTAGKGDDGYNVLYGGGLFKGYDDHPRQRLTFNGITSTAAGRYQLLSKYFDAYKSQLGLADFSPISQDLIAIQQIKECRAIPLIETGNLEAAIAKCAHIWASLPGAGYGQHEQKLSTLTKAYIDAGGVIS